MSHADLPPLLNTFPMSSLEVKASDSSTTSFPMPISSSTATLSSLPPTTELVGKETLEEIEKLIATKEKEIEDILNRMTSEIGAANEITFFENSFESAESVRALLEAYPHLTLKSTDNIVEIFSSVLPADLPRYTNIQAHTEIAQNILFLGTTLLQCANGATLFLEMVCRKKMMDKSQVLYDKLYQEYEDKLLANKDFTTSEEKKAIEQFFENWKTKLDFQQLKWKQAKVEFVVSNSHYLLYAAGTITSKISSLPILSEASVIGLKGLSVFLNGWQLFRSLINEKLLSSWQEKYEEWQAKIKEENSIDKRNDDVLKTAETSKERALETAEKVTETQVKKEEASLKKLPPFSPTDRSAQQRENVLRQFDLVITDAKKLTDKREAIAAKKISTILFDYENYESKIKARAQIYYDSIENKKEGFPLFQGWFNAQPKENLVKIYVDHQSVIEQSVKDSLKFVVETKHHIEKGFSKLNLISAGLATTMALVSLALTTVLIAGVVTAPLGIGLLVLISSVGPSALFLGIVFTDIAYNLYKKRLTTKSITYPPRIAIAEIMVAFRQYRLQSKQKKMMVIAHQIKNLNEATQTSQTTASTKKTANALAQKGVAYQSIKEAMNNQEEKLRNWKKRLVKLEKEYSRRGWEDFINQTPFTTSTYKKGQKTVEFNALQALNAALIETDFSLLNAETKLLLRRALGVDLEKLQQEIEKDPEVISFAIQQYTALSKEGLVNFIQKQQVGEV